MYNLILIKILLSLSVGQDQDLDPSDQAGQKVDHPSNVDPDPSHHPKSLIHHLDLDKDHDLGLIVNPR